ncbi:hypothetical protein ILYODFUR_033699 [Ilyodon furcidens]|uniref:Uncharacterized protein n=1 Tax=Ilyodon furcidens TaxID=33524 RepID=A0ABV0U2Q0_9TELE
MDVTVLQHTGLMEVEDRYSRRRENSRVVKDQATIKSFCFLCQRPEPALVFHSVHDAMKETGPQNHRSSIILNSGW